MLISDIIAAIEQEAPLSLQESYDNAGMQVGDKSALCTGVLLCVDVTPSVIDEAIERDCNLVVSHHPLIFRGLKHITGATPQELAIIKAITAGVAVYSAHTNLDSASRGVNYTLARRLGIAKPSPLECPDPANPGIGLGAVGDLELPLTPMKLIERVKSVCQSPITRCSTLPCSMITRIALCGGSGASLINAAIAHKAQAFVTSDVKYHDFVDYSDRLLIIDIGHYESEMCTKHIFYHILSGKFPNFAVNYSETEKNPINYL